MKVWLLAACFLVGAYTVAFALDCSNGGESQSDMNDCAHQKWEKADKELNRKFKVIMSCFKPFPGSQQPFLDAQRAWLKFRDAECRLQGSASEGGSVQPMIVDECLASLTERRNKDLSDYLSCPEGDLACPLPTACRTGKPEKSGAQGRDDIQVTNTPEGLTLSVGKSSFIAQRVDASDLLKRVSAMNGSARDAKIDVRILRCERMLSASVGVADGNTSYSGFCSVERNGQISQSSVCNDELVGHFHEEAVTGAAPTDKDLVVSMGRHCWGG